MSERERVALKVPAGAFAVVYLEQRPGGWLVGWSTGRDSQASQSKQAADREIHRPTKFVALDAARLEMFAWWQWRDAIVSHVLEDPFDVADLVDGQALEIQGGVSC